eukprot:6059039-Lingulodinium_polyedra.AAC.1
MQCSAILQNLHEAAMGERALARGVQHRSGQHTERDTNQFTCWFLCFRWHPIAGHLCSVPVGGAHA